MIVMEYSIVPISTKINDIYYPFDNPFIGILINWN